MYIVNLYNIRWRKKYTQEEIMAATGLSRNTVNRLFKCQYYDFKLSTLETIAKFNPKIGELIASPSISILTYIY